MMLIIQVVLCLQCFRVWPDDQGTIIPPENFVQIAAEGFGDPHNNAAWSMAWWKGKLYVGTVRDWFCWSIAATNAQLPFIPYPGLDDDRHCAESPLDLPLQAEIWCYTPETGRWERVYQSPSDIPIPKDPTKFVARDVGYRGMVAFTEPDGTEALYVLGTNARRWTMTEDEQVPCPRILRTTDGLTFTALEPDPQTQPCVEGYDGVVACYRSSTIFNGHLFLTAGNLQGTGVLMETDDPSAGKDNIRAVNTADVKIWDMEPFNGYLYIGTRNPDGYAILKTDAAGTPPYTFTPVVTAGGYLNVNPSISIVSMHVFRDRLYIGTDKPAELIRINPDDSWDLVVGKPRRTPDGKKYPLSGFGPGFDWPMNVHVWRMQDHEGVLYAGTADQSTRMRNVSIVGKLLEPEMGFDLYASKNGWVWTMLTTDGFGDKWQMGIRTFASTPYGLFLGTCNFWGGLQIWQGVPETAIITQQLRTAPAAPEGLEAEQKNGTVILSWDSLQQGCSFRVFRCMAGRGTDSDNATAACSAFEALGTTDQTFYVDTPVLHNRIYTYYVVAEDATLQVSAPSNAVRVPSLFPSVCFGNLHELLRIPDPSAKKILQKACAEARTALGRTSPEQARSILHKALKELSATTALQPWQVEDVTMLVNKLIRRITLAQKGILSVSDIE